MLGLVATPFATISKSMSSHRAAQGVIYADQIQEHYSGKIDINMSGDKYIDDYSDYTDLFVYHGNDWGGSLNLFGGLENFGGIQNLISLSKFKGKVYSLAIDMPDYYKMMREKLDKQVEKGKSYHPDWDLVDWDNLNQICQNAETLNPNTLMNHERAAIGDSHAICMYRRGWQVNSVPFKTLHGALKEGLESFLPNRSSFKEIEIYFGNIDVRHHLLRQSNPEQAVKDIVKEYVEQADALASKHDCQVKLYELLPIENESRKVPKTGWYKGTPFYGSWAERNEIRKLFKQELFKRTAAPSRVTVYEWIGSMINSSGELDYEYMEKPQSIHLSRNWYPHWQGYEWSHAPYREYTPTPEKEQMSLEDFFA